MKNKNKNKSVRYQIGDRIKALRVERGLSQLQLAELTGFRQPNIARIEAGRYAITVDTLEVLLSVLNASIEIVKCNPG